MTEVKSFTWDRNGIHFDEGNNITAVDAEVIQREIDRWSETLELLKGC